MRIGQDRCCVVVEPREHLRDRGHELDSLDLLAQDQAGPVAGSHPEGDDQHVLGLRPGDRREAPPSGARPR